MTVASLRTDLDRLATRARDVIQAIATERAVPPSSEAHEWAKALSRQCESALADLVSLIPQPLLMATARHLDDSHGIAIPSLRELANQGSNAAREQLSVLEHLALQATEMSQMEYGFLFNSAQRQLAIGYNAGERRLDASYYDLLA